MLATKGRVRELEHKRRVIEEKIRKDVGGHELVAKRLEQTEFEFQVLAGEDGKLFGSITNADIAGRLGEQGIRLDRRKIELVEPIKQLGEYEVTLKLHRKVRITSVAIKRARQLALMPCAVPTDAEAEALGAQNFFAPEGLPFLCGQGNEH